MEYVDMIVEAAAAERRLVAKTWQVLYQLRVIASPAGAMAAEHMVSLSYASRDLQEQLGALESGALDQAGLIRLGRALGALLLPEQPSPTSMYDLFVRSLDLLGPDRGLRLRLRLPPLLAALPWEYAYLDRADNPASLDGFLALNPRVVMVRDEVLATPSTLAPLEGPIKVVAALAIADGMAPLDLASEEANLRQALDGQPGIAATYLRDATLDEVLAHLPGAAVFHFAGHGTFERRGADAPGTYSGKGSLALLDRAVDADQLAVNLGAGGVRLALLGGCLTGRRDGISVWSGVAPALVRSHAQVPAVVANQLKIKDASAIAFSQAFYRALVGGLSVEEAVAVGRIAVYNADGQGHDWGVPVLYLRPGDGHLFAGAADPAIRAAARSRTVVTVAVQAQRVASGGYVAGAEIGTLRAGLLGVTVRLGAVAGAAVGAAVGAVEGGTAAIDATVESVASGGSVVGARIDTLGGPSERPPEPAA